MRQADWGGTPRGWAIATILYGCLFLFAGLARTAAAVRHHDDVLQWVFAALLLAGGVLTVRRGVHRLRRAGLPRPPNR